MSLRILVLAGVILAGCAEPVEAPTVWNDGDAVGRTDRWVDDGSAVALLDGGRALVLVSGSVQLHDPRLAEPITVWTGQKELRGGAWLGEPGLLVATENGVRFYDGELWPSPIEDQTNGPIVDLVEHRRSRWVMDDGGWHWGLDDAWSTPTLDGRPASLRVVPVSATSAWLQYGDQMLLLSRAPGEEGGWTLEEEAYFPGLRDVARDGAGALWATEGVELYGFAGGEQLELGAPRTYAWETPPSLPLPSVVQVAASADVPGVWVETTGGPWHGDADGMSRVEVPDGFWLQVDALGGLIVRTETEGDPALDVVRTSPALGLWDVPAVVGGTQQVDVTLDPRPAAVDGLQIRLDDTVLDVPDAPPYTVRLPLDGLPRGEHTVTAVGTWDGVDVETSAQLDLQSGVVTWDDHVLPLAQDECMACHSGNAETILETATDWQSRIDLVVEVLEQKKMPLGTETGLAEEQIELVRLWAAGGFQ